MTPFYEDDFYGEEREYPDMDELVDAEYEEDEEPEEEPDDFGPEPDLESDVSDEEDEEDYSDDEDDEEDYYPMDHAAIFQPDE